MTVPIPDVVQERLQRQFDALIAEGEGIHRTIRVIPGKWHEPFVRSQEPYQDPAVLERALRTVCTSAQPAISTVSPDGKPFMMNRLIDELKKAGAIDEMRAKQLRWYTDIRNKAAHGRLEELSRSDVEQLLEGVRVYLDDLTDNREAMLPT